jgi:hypothetical protein
MKLSAPAASAGTSWPPLVSDTTERSTTNTSGSPATFTTLTLPSVAAAVPLLVKGLIRKSAGATEPCYLGITLNSTVLISPGGFATFSSVNRAESGHFEIYIPPRVTLYQKSVQYTATTHLASSATPVVYTSFAQVADCPDVLTGLTLTGASGNASITFAIKDIHVYSMG